MRACSKFRMRMLRKWQRERVSVLCTAQLMLLLIGRRQCYIDLVVWHKNALLTHLTSSKVKFLPWEIFLRTTWVQLSCCVGDAIMGCFFVCILLIGDNYTHFPLFTVIWNRFVEGLEFSCISVEFVTFHECSSFRLGGIIVPHRGEAKQRRLAPFGINSSCHWTFHRLQCVS